MIWVRAPVRALALAADEQAVAPELVQAADVVAGMAVVAAAAAVPAAGVQAGFAAAVWPGAVAAQVAAWGAFQAEVRAGLHHIHKDFHCSLAVRVVAPRFGLCWLRADLRGHCFWAGWP